ncbi:MAG: flagellar protein FlaG [Gammaproteobacteria bacterium]|nr:flagellar protein FlaG [Gammaproteobacteria bacterium]
MGIERIVPAGSAAWARLPDATGSAGAGSGTTGTFNLKALEAPKAAVPPPALEIAVDQINQALAQARRELAFSVDEHSGRTVVRVIDAGSGEVVRQMPSEEVLKLADRLRAGLDAQSIGVDQWS